MPVVTPPTITALPSPPDPANRSTFNTLAYPWSVAQQTFATQVGAVATNVAANATDAATSATTAATQAGAASTSATTATTQATAAAASAASAAALAGAFVGTSTTSLAIGAGNKVFTTQAGEQYTTGIFMTAVSAGNTANYMGGQVVSYSGTTLTINVTLTGGSGTYTDWNLSIAGPVGPPGPTFTGGLLTTAINVAKGPDLASAATLDIWTGTQGNTMVVTGTTTTTAFTTAPQAGAERKLVAAAAWPLTNGANLILPGGTNYTCTAGDVLEVLAVTTTQFRLLITRADGTAVIGGAGGATTTTSATSITLTASSSRVQVVTMTAPNQSVNLPSATTLTTGGPLYVIKNVTGQSFTVNDGGGNALAVIDRNSVIAFYCTSIATVAGTWFVGNQSASATPLAELFANISNVVTAIASNSPKTVLLTTTKLLCLFAGTSNNFSAVVLDISGNTITPGTVYTTATAIGDFALTALSATKAVAVFRNTTSTFLNSVILDVSGSTITAGTVVAGTVVLRSAQLGVSTLSATKAICVYPNSSVDCVDSVIIDVSGSTITYGTVLTGATSCNNAVVTTLTSTKALCVFRNFTTGFLNSMVLDVSGSTITAGAVVVASAVNGAIPVVATLSSTKAIASYTTGGVTVYAVILDVSGSTVSVGTTASLAVASATFVAGNVLTVLNSGQAICVYKNNTSTFAEGLVINISGSTIYFGSPVVLTSYAISWPVINWLSANRSVMTAQNATSTFLQSAIVSNAL